jgi:aspartyl-tRNA(Asn)/glutamyl-tRNA(Gln) amidotransferase subunit C
MEFTKEQIEHIARLSRIEISPREQEKFSKEISSVLNYMKILNEINTDEVEPTAQVTGLSNVLRVDEVHPSDEETIRIMKANFPDNVADFLKVPAVFQNHKDQKTYEAE